MTDHDALAADLSAFGVRLAAAGYGWEAIITREGPTGEETVAHLTTANPDAAGVRVIGDAGLRDRLRMAVGPVIGDHIGGDYPEVPMTVLYRFQSALVDAVLAALTGDTPESDHG